jgi:hypothetical protein
MKRVSALQEWALTHVVNRPPGGKRHEPFPALPQIGLKRSRKNDNIVRTFLKRQLGRNVAELLVVSGRAIQRTLEEITCHYIKTVPKPS